MKSKFFISIIVVISVVGIILYGLQLQMMNVQEPQAAILMTELVSGGVPPDGIPSIDHPKFVSVDEAKHFVHNNTLGMFVEVGDDKRFYPFNVLVWHEIVNDVVGGKPLAITFCPLCSSALAFDRTVDGSVLEFGTSGLLYQSNLVMYDRETKSLWSQILGKAIVGQRVGTNLTLYPADTILFSSVQERVPDAKVLSTDTGFVRDYEHNPYVDYEATDEIVFPLNHVDLRLPAKTLVWTISIEGVMKAYVMDALGRDNQFTDIVNGHELKFTIDAGKITIFDETTDENVIGFRAFWFAVATHNSDVLLWKG